MTTSTQRIRNSHDDPVVVDNGPVRVDFGTHHEPKQGSSDTWTRECTHLHRLVITEIQLFTEPRTSTFVLDPTKPVTLHLNGFVGSGPKTDTMIVASDGSNISVKSKGFKHALDSSTKGRYLRSDAQERPVITKVRMWENGASKETDFEPSGLPGTRALIVAFIPVPE